MIIMEKINSINNYQTQNGLTIEIYFRYTKQGGHDTSMYTGEVLKCR